MHALFEQAPVPLWVADFQATAPLLADYIGQDYEQILKALAADPELLRTCAETIRVARANPAAARMMGFEHPGQMLGRLVDLLPPAAVDALKGQIAAVASGHTPLCQEAIEVGAPDQRMVVELHLSLPDPADWSRVLVATIDRTHRVHAEDRLRASEERFRAICEHAPVMIDQFDAQGNCVLWNRQCEMHLGWTHEEICAHADPLTLFYPDQAERQRVIESITRADGEFREYRVLAKDGSYRQQMWADLQLPSGQQISVGHDVSEQREAEKRQRDFEEQLRQTQKLESLGLLAGGIAHDFNNLLVGVLANADLARVKRPHDAELREMLDGVVDAAQRAAGLSRQLLAYSGGAAFTPVPLDLNELIEDLAPMIAASAAKRVSISYELQDGLPPMEGDPTQLRQVVFNLVLNASEALEGRSGHVSVHTKLDGDRLRLDVNDNGSGMDEATRNRMFDPFFTTKFTGRGLGLASVLGIVRGHDGHIEVDSEPGIGTTCHVWFPSSNTAPVSRPPEKLDTRDHQGLVMVVDDEPSVRNATARLLEALGYQAQPHPGGDQALAWFEQNAAQVRLALVDATMPDLSGPELILALRRIRPDLPALLVSGYTPDSLEGLDQTTTRFVQKPFTTATLASAVTSVLSDPGDD